MLPEWLHIIIKRSKKKHVRYAYLIGLFILFSLGYIILKVNEVILNVLSGPILGLYIFLGIYISLVYNIPIFNKYAWHGNREPELGVYDLLHMIVLFVLGLYFMFLN